MTDFDQALLAKRYEEALELEKAGHLEEAATLYRQILEIDPDDHVGASVRLASFGQGPVPEKAPLAYVSTLFDQHASAFEQILVDDLGYAVPMMVREMIVKCAPERRFARMLDLGCGTGLTGISMKEYVDNMIGVDISTGMLDEAYDKEIYDDLYQGDVVDFLKDIEDDGQGEPEGWDLIVSTDVLPYLGELDVMFSEVARCLDPDGLFAFSSETLPEEEFDGADFTMGRKQRFAHSESYIRKLLTENKMALVHLEPIVVRSDEGKPIYGHLVLGRKQ